MDGLWILSESNQRLRQMHYIDAKFFEAFVDLSTGRIIRSQCGIFQFEPESELLKKKPMFATEDWRDLLGKPFAVKIIFPEESTYFHRGTSKLWSIQEGKGTLQDVTDFSAEPSILDGIWVAPVSPNIRAVKAYGNGRVIVLHLNLKKRSIDAQNIGVFSISEKGILREKVLYSTDNWSSGRGQTFVSQTSFSGPGEFASGRDQWRRIGTPVEAERFAKYRTGNLKGP